MKHLEALYVNRSQNPIDEQSIAELAETHRYNKYPQLFLSEAQRTYPGTPVDAALKAYYRVSTEILRMAASLDPADLTVTAGPFEDHVKFLGGGREWLKGAAHVSKIDSELAVEIRAATEYLDSLDEFHIYQSLCPDETDGYMRTIRSLGSEPAVEESTRSPNLAYALTALAAAASTIWFALSLW